MLVTFLQKATIFQLLVTSLQAEGQTFKSRQRQRIFLEPSCPSRCMYRLSLQSNGYW